MPGARRYADESFKRGLRKARLGEAAFRVEEALSKRIERLRAMGRTHDNKGRALRSCATSMTVDGLLHEHWCPCADCQYGQIADFKRIRAGKQVWAEYEEPGRHRRGRASEGVRTLA
jgi:hypothetical protein